MYYLVILALINNINSDQNFELSPIIDALYEPIQDVSFEFEGTFRIGAPGDPLGSNSPNAFIADKFSGLFMYRSDGFVKLESYHQQQSMQGNQSRRFVVAKKLSTVNGRTMRYEEQSGQGNAVTSAAGFADYFRIGSPTYIFFVQYLKAFSQYPNKFILKEADKKIGDVNCGVFSFIIGKDYDKGHSSFNDLERYYLDYERNGHPIKVEYWRGNNMEAHVTDVKLEIFNANGRQVWLPVFGKYESFLGLESQGDKLIFSSHPSNTITLSVMKSSVKLNQNLKDDSFILKLKNGVVITDGVRGTRTRAGDSNEPAPQSLQDAERQLNNMLKDAENNKKELLASSPSQSGDRVFTILLWVITFTSLILLALFYFKLRFKKVQ